MLAYNRIDFVTSLACRTHIIVIKMKLSSTNWCLGPCHTYAISSCRTSFNQWNNGTFTWKRCWHWLKGTCQFYNAFIRQGAYDCLPCQGWWLVSLGIRLVNSLFYFTGWKCIFLVELFTLPLQVNGDQPLIRPFWPPSVDLCFDLIRFSSWRGGMIWRLHRINVTLSGWGFHYNDVIMSAVASQITSVSIVCSTVGSGVKKTSKLHVTGDR